MTLINDFLSLIYPRHCEACGNHLFQHEHHLCNYCKLNLPESHYHREADSELSRVFAGRVPFTKVMSLYVFEKSGRVQKLLHAIKYQKQKELALFLGKLYAARLLKDGAGEGIDLIIPIPLHEKKLRQRGFNQSEWFARGLASGLEIEMNAGLMKRQKETGTQTRKRKFERWENVEGIFEIAEKEILKNRHVLVVDDVITTGATIEAAWQSLKEIEGLKISVASIAFAKKS
jgi:ComF family protein